MPVTLTLANDLRVPRRREWLCRGVPFPQGCLGDVRGLSLRNEGGSPVPLAAERLAVWPDGSVRWALLQFPATLAPQARVGYTLDWDGPPAQGPGPRVTLTRSDEAWAIDNGCLQLRLPAAGRAFVTDLSRAGRVWVPSVYAEIEDHEGSCFVSELVGEPRVERHTDRMLVIGRRGVHRDEAGRKLFACVFRVTVFAGAEDVEVEYQFIHDEPWREGSASHERPMGVGHVQVRTDSPGFRELHGVRLVLEHTVAAPHEFATCPLGTVGTQGLFTSAEPLRAALFQGMKTGLYDFMMDADVRLGDRVVAGSHGWVSVGDGEGGVAASVRKFAQQWPKGWAAGGQQITLELWPGDAGPLHLFQGQAKTHGVAIRLFEGTAAEAHLPDWHFAYQFPITLSAPDWYLDSGALGPVFRYQPKRYPRLEARFRMEFEQFLCYNRALGMIDYGDFASLGEESWGRPEWISNCEHDFGQSVYLQAVRTGLYRYFDTFEACIRHVMDMDCMHFDDHFDEVGGWREHGSLHVLCDTGPSCHPSHMWAEGFVSFYYLTGYVPALDAACGVADLIARRVEAGQWGTTDARSRGWPLIALAAVYRATGDERHAGVMRTIVQSFVEGPDPLLPSGACAGGWGPIPYTQAVMGAIAATGLACHHRLFGGDLSRELFLRATDYLCTEDVRTPEGLYLAMPGNDTAMNYAAHSCYRESLGYAWELTGDRKYLEAGMRQVEDNMASTIPAHSIVTMLRMKDSYEVVQVDGVRLSVTWRELLRFFDYADHAGMLSDW